MSGGGDSAEGGPPACRCWRTGLPTSLLSSLPVCPGYCYNALPDSLPVGLQVLADATSRMEVFVDKTIQLSNVSTMSAYVSGSKVRHHHPVTGAYLTHYTCVK